jgi:hypothetical protein
MMAEMTADMTAVMMAGLLEQPLSNTNIESRGIQSYCYLWSLRLISIKKIASLFHRHTMDTRQTTTLCRNQQMWK